MRRSRIGVGLLALLVIGCMDQSRVNSTCTWSDSAARPLDLSRASDREHLRVDVRVAGELAVRFADATNRSVASLNRPLRERCLGGMYDSVMTRHAVTRGDVAAAALARIWWVDLLFVYCPMALLTVAAMDRVTRGVLRSFDSDSRRIAVGAAVALATVVAAIAIGVAQAWAFGLESMLLRNEHVSFRAFEIPVMLHGWVAYLIALALCLPTTILCFRRQARRPTTRRTEGRFSPSWQ